MSVIHRPWVTKHGTYCTCKVFCGSDPTSWESHAVDIMILDPEAQVDYRKLSAIEIAIRPIVQSYIEVANQVERSMAKMAESFKVSARASQKFQSEYTRVTTQILEDQARCKHRRIFTTSDDKTVCIDCGANFPGAATFNDDDLPGMWSHSDFEGGDPDERSYAQRCRDGDHLFTNFKDNDHTANQHLRCVFCGVQQGG